MTSFSRNSIAILLFLLFQSGQCCGAEMLEKLRLKYQNVAGVVGELQVEKTSSLVKKPVVSEVTLEADDRRIVWKTTRPVSSKVEIVDGVVTIDGEKVPSQVNDSVKPLVEVIGYLMMFNIEKLSEHFALAEDGDRLVGSVKDTAMARFFDSISIRFDSKLNPTDIEIARRGGEKTILRVMRLQTLDCTKGAKKSCRS